VGETKLRGIARACRYAFRSGVPLTQRLPLLHNANAQVLCFCRCARRGVHGAGCRPVITACRSRRRNEIFHMSRPQYKQMSTVTKEPGGSEPQYYKPKRWCLCKPKCWHPQCASPSAGAREARTSGAAPISNLPPQECTVLVPRGLQAKESAESETYREQVPCETR
jgi:hypothetical protein